MKHKLCDWCGEYDEHLMEFEGEWICGNCYFLHEGELYMQKEKQEEGE